MNLESVAARRRRAGGETGCYPYEDVDHTPMVIPHSTLPHINSAKTFPSPFSIVLVRFHCNQLLAFHNKVFREFSRAIRYVLFRLFCFVPLYAIRRPPPGRPPTLNSLGAVIHEFAFLYIFCLMTQLNRIAVFSRGNAVTP